MTFIIEDVTVTPSVLAAGRVASKGGLQCPGCDEPFVLDTVVKKLTFNPATEESVVRYYHENCLEDAFYNMLYS